MKTITTLSFFLLLHSLSPAWAEDATPTPVPVDAGRVHRAQEFLDKGNDFAAHGLTYRAKEYWKIAFEMDPNLTEARENWEKASGGKPTPVPSPTPAPAGDQETDLETLNHVLKQQPASKAAQGLPAPITHPAAQANAVDNREKRLKPKKAKKPGGPADQAWAGLKKAVQSGDQQAAQGAWDAIALLSPHDPRLAGWKAKIQAMAPKVKVGVDPAQADTLYTQGAADFAANNFAKAKEELQQALQLNPDSALIQGALKELYEKHPELK